MILISDKGRIGIKAPSFDENDALIGVFDTVLNKVAEDLLESRTVHVNFWEKTEFGTFLHLDLNMQSFLHGLVPK